MKVHGLIVVKLKLQPQNEHRYQCKPPPPPGHSLIFLYYYHWNEREQCLSILNYLKVLHNMLSTFLSKFKSTYLSEFETLEAKSELYSIHFEDFTSNVY